MKKLTTLLSLVLALCLMLTVSGCGSRESASSEPKIKIDRSLSADEAFETGNEAYKAKNYAEAEAYYAFAREKAGEAVSYTEGDMINNRVLALLQLERNEEALSLCRELVAGDYSSTQRDYYGYLLNLMVCAHANGLSAADELREALGEEYCFCAEDLLSEADNDPGSYTKLLIALIYNAIYIDMELEPFNDEYADLYSYSIVPSLYEMHTMFFEKPTAEELEAWGYGNGGHLDFFYMALDELNERNEQTFGESDEDILALQEYLDALREILAGESDE